MKISLSTAAFGMIAASFLNMPASYARILTQDNFDSDRAGSFPSGWTLQFNGAGTSLQVVDTTHYVSRPNALKLVGSECWSANAYRSVAFPQPQPKPHQHVQLSGDVFVDYLGTGGCSNATAVFGLANPSVGQWGAMYAGVVFGSDGFVYASAGSTNTKLSAYSVGKWRRVSLDVDMTAGTFEVTVEGVLLASGVPVGAGFSPTAVLLDTGHGSNDPTVWYDNIVVRTPEVSE